MGTGIELWESGYQKKEVGERLGQAGFKIMKSAQEKFHDKNFTEIQIFVLAEKA